MSVATKGSLNQFTVESLLTTIATHHETIIASQINPSNLGVIKVLVRTPNISPRVDCRLRRREVVLGLE